MAHDQRGRRSPLRSVSHMSLPIPLTGVKTTPLQCEYRWIPIFSFNTSSCFYTSLCNTVTSYPFAPPDNTHTERALRPAVISL